MRLLVGLAALWAALIIAFVVTDGGDREEAVSMVTIGLLMSASVVIGDQGVRLSPERAGAGHHETEFWRRFVVIAAVTGVVLASAVGVLTSRTVHDWLDAAATWALSFAAIAAVQLTFRRRQPRR